MSARRILWIVMCGLLALGGQAAAQELGDGRGIDHVASLVRLENFDAAVNVWTGQLGFSATPALLSPLGAKNSLIWFSDLAYLEIATFTELNEFTAPFLAFLEDHEGAKFYGTDVADAAQAMTFLTGAGYANVGPFPAPPLTIEATGEVVGLSPLWSSIVLLGPVAPDNSNFFLDYDEAQVQQMFADFPALAPSRTRTRRRGSTLSGWWCRTWTRPSLSMRASASTSASSTRRSTTSALAARRCGTTTAPWLCWSRMVPAWPRTSPRSAGRGSWV